ncbi:hypothetical protein RUM43_005104 [Polyplax serrata]|uniref:Uncharacterized protein n=1 Tax=Polyplax serrata TaxID=468196 RepID=A0AAN8SCZ8_POLSC
MRSLVILSDNLSPYFFWHEWRTVHPRDFDFDLFSDGPQKLGRGSAFCCLSSIFIPDVVCYMICQSRLLLLNNNHVDDDDDDDDDRGDDDDDDDDYKIQIEGYGKEVIFDRRRRGGRRFHSGSLHMMDCSLKLQCTGAPTIVATRLGPPHYPKASDVARG